MNSKSVKMTIRTDTGHLEPQISEMTILDDGFLFIVNPTTTASIFVDGLSLMETDLTYAVNEIAFVLELRHNASLAFVRNLLPHAEFHPIQKIGLLAIFEKPITEKTRDFVKSLGDKTIGCTNKFDCSATYLRYNYIYADRLSPYLHKTSQAQWITDCLEDAIFTFHVSVFQGLRNFNHYFEQLFATSWKNGLLCRCNQITNVPKHENCDATFRTVTDLRSHLLKTNGFQYICMNYKFCKIVRYNQRELDGFVAHALKCTSRYRSRNQVATQASSRQMNSETLVYDTRETMVGLVNATLKTYTRKYPLIRLKFSPRYLHFQLRREDDEKHGIRVYYADVSTRTPVSSSYLGHKRW